MAGRKSLIFKLTINCPYFDLSQCRDISTKTITNRNGEKLELVLGEDPDISDTMGWSFQSVCVMRMPKAARMPSGFVNVVG